MALSFLKPQELTASFIAFGKLPCQPDFIRIHAGHPVAQELDERVQSALASMEEAEGWESAFDASPVSDLIYTSGDGRWQFHGTLFPSFDRSGRRFPILGGAVLPTQELEGRLPLVPLAREGFLVALAAQLEAYGSTNDPELGCREYLELGDLPWSVDAAEWELAEGILGKVLREEAPGAFARYLQQMRLPSGMNQAILHMAFFRDFLDRFPAPTPAQLIRLPLGTGPGETALQASLWLSILSALGLVQGRPRECVLITHTAPSAHLHVSVGRGLTRLLSSALGVPPQPDAFLDLSGTQETWHSHPLYATSAYALERLVEDPDLTLAHLLTFLADLRQKIANTSH